MTYSAQATINHGQSSNDADGVVTGTIPGVQDDIVVLGVAINNGTNTITVTDNGDAGNPWTRLSTSNPDVVSSALDVAVFGKKLGATDVGKTVTVTSTIGGIREPVAMAAFSGRSSVADIQVARAQDTDGNNTVDPANISPGASAGVDWDIVQVYFTRKAAGTQVTMSGVPTNSTKRSEAATNFGVSPNLAVTIVSRDGVDGSATYGTSIATLSTTVNQAIEYTLALKSTVASNAAPTANAGADQTGKAVGVTVTLDGTGSTDSDGTITGWSWTQTAGTSVGTITGATTDTATFTVPSVAADETLTFQLEVTDDDGATDTDTCTVGILADPSLGDDGGLRLYYVEAGGTTTEMALYYVLGDGSLLELADTGV